MPERSIDIEHPPRADIERAGRVAPVAYGKDRRRQKRRLALAAVGMTRQDPSSYRTEDRQVDGVGIVAEYDAIDVAGKTIEGCSRRKIRSPKIVDAGHGQP